MASRVGDALSGTPKLAIVTDGSSGIGLKMVKIEKGYHEIPRPRRCCAR